MAGRRDKGDRRPASPASASPAPPGQRPPAAGTLPTRAALVGFIKDSPGRVGKREIARAFGLGPEHRVALRGLLKSLGETGDAAPAGHRRFTAPGRLADATVVVVTGTDPDGDPIARPSPWEGDGPPPLVHMAPEPPGQPALGPGERVLARLRPIGAGRYEGRTLNRLAAAPPRVLGAFRADGAGGRVVPTDRRQKAEWLVPQGETGGAVDDDLVFAEPLPRPAGRHFGLSPARVVEVLGRLGDARSVSLVSIATHGIPDVFPPDVLADAARAEAAPLGTRTDLRDVPLVTIDGADARDFDDAVHAEPEGDGWRLLVAIADVAHYVRPGSPLDREALRRGNSAYFPDRVVPMLPEALSNGWCSLKPGEDRSCLFAEMRIDREGRKLSHRFGRGLMRSAARLTYEQIQAARDRARARSGDIDIDGDGLELPAGSVAALYDAFAALLGARTRRGTLDLDLPERRVVLGDDGRVASVSPRPRLDSHRLIEEFMVLANVAAAEELERLRRPCVYRVHPPPSDEKLASLRDFLSTLGISLKPAGAVRPADLDAILARVRDTDMAPQVNEVMLRSQSQAEYNPDNIGHFGLSLIAYAHFTSPIRRYADLLVHRSLIAGLHLGPGGLESGAEASFPDQAEAITATERRAALAERDAIDRYLAAYMADRVGASFPARISGVTRFGLFVTLNDIGASGLLPVSSLPGDFWMHDEKSQALIGRRTRASFRLTDPIEVTLADANKLTGTLLFSMSVSSAGVPAGRSAPPSGPSDPPQSRGRKRRM